MVTKQWTYIDFLQSFWQDLSADVLRNQNDTFYFFESTSVHTFTMKMLFLEE